MSQAQLITQNHFCDHVAEFDPRWPRDGSFENSLMTLVHEFIDPSNPTGHPDWDCKYIVECLGVWDAIGRKVCHTGQMISSCPKTVLVSVHKVDEIDCPVRTHPPQQGYGAPPDGQQHVQQHSPENKHHPQVESGAAGEDSKGATAMPSAGHSPLPYTGLLNQALKISTQIPQEMPWSPITMQKGVQLNSTGLGTTRARIVYQPKMSTPTLDPMSTATQLGAVGGALESSFLGPMIECPNGAGVFSMFIDHGK